MMLSISYINLHTLCLAVLSQIILLSSGSILNPSVEKLKTYCDNHKNLPINILGNRVVTLDFDFLCSSVFEDKVLVSPEMTQAVSDIYSINQQYCLNPNAINQDPDFDLIQKRQLIHGKEKIFDDNLRSKLLSCLSLEFNVVNTSIQPPANEKLRDEVVRVYTRNTLDFILGYINPANVDLLDLVYHNFRYGELLSRLTLELGFDKIETYQMEDYLNDELILKMWEDRSLKDLVPINSDITSKNINKAVLTLESQITKLECNDILLFNYVIKEMSYIYLAITFYLELLDRKQYYKLRFSPLYFPNVNNYDEILLWLALRGSSYQNQVLYYSSLLKAEDNKGLFNIHSIKEIILQLFDNLRHKHKGYYDLYLNVHMISKTYLSSGLFKKSILENYTLSNLCSTA